ncbi:MAG: GTPase [Xanthomonadales bacterium]|nr:GTPase [Xanthomonadales bacterium]
MPIRLLVAIVATVVVVAVLVAILVATDTVLSIWERLDQVAPWAVGLYLAFLIIVAAFLGWFVLRLVLGRPARRRDDETPLTRETLESRLNRSGERGVQVEGAQAELEELDQRSGADSLYLAMFGEASAGKSALINALAPDARQTSDPRGGTTREIRVFEWQPPDGVPIRLVDLPGFGHEETRNLSDAARDEALRAHLVIYVAEGDLTRDQHAELVRLTEFRKPLVVALNKADRYSDEELASIRTRLAETIPAETALEVVPVSAGGREEIVVVDSDGSESIEARDREPRVAALIAAIETVMTGERREDLRERHARSALQLSARKLAEAENRYRSRAAEHLVEKYARRAIIGALAALTPGSDLVIQGALASKLIHDLCRLYDVSVREIDLDRFLTLAGGRVRRTTAVVLAVAGNGLKAFPGLGTVAGGLVHAVAYGMIFDSLGRAVAQALHEHGALKPEQTVEHFEKRLLEKSPERTRQLAGLALKHWKDRGQ